MPDIGGKRHVFRVSNNKAKTKKKLIVSVTSISRIVFFILHFLKLFQYDPVVTPGNEKIVHHVVLYRCRGEEPKYAHMDYDCYATTTDYRPECRSVFLMYEIGAGVGSS